MAPEDPVDDDALRLAREIADAYRDGTAAGPPPPRRRRRGSSRPHRDDATSVGDFLGALADQQGWNQHLASSRVFTDWASIVGPEVAQHCTVEDFSDGVVHLRATSTAWAKEITLLAPRLVAKLNELLGDGSVLRIDVRGPAAPSWTKGRRTVKGRGPRDTYG